MCQRRPEEGEREGQTLLLNNLEMKEPCLCWRLTRVPLAAWSWRSVVCGPLHPG